MQKPSWPGPKPAGSLLAPCPLARPLPRGGGHLDPAAQSVWRKGRGARADPGPVADCQGRLEEVTTSLGLLPVWELCGGKEPSTVPGTGIPPGRGLHDREAGTEPRDAGGEGAASLMGSRGWKKRPRTPSSRVSRGVEPAESEGPGPKATWIKGWQRRL